MQYVNTRKESPPVSAQQAIVKGLADGGGLYTPESIPALTAADIEKLAGMSYQERCAYVLSLYLTDFSYDKLLGFTNESYRQPSFTHTPIAPVVMAGKNTALLELWHGPTSAFKDMALQIMPHLLTASLRKCGEKRTAVILVATSGDTGKAALEGFADVPQTKIIVMYPAEGVSDVQKLQMVTQEGGNVGVVGIKGNFDDAQTETKRIFEDAGLAQRLNENGMFFSSANSINLGRLLPQIVYYISAWLDLVNSGALRQGQEFNVCVPTGNFGNILSAYLAKRMGGPIGRLICASNSNNVLTDFINTGVYDKNRPFYQTPSPSMDILVSSNVERLLYYISGMDAQCVAGYMRDLRESGRYALEIDAAQELKEYFTAGFCTDEETFAELKRFYDEHNYLADPHTAVALSVLRRYRENTGDGRLCVVASTASPYKFPDSVLKALTGKTYEATLDSNDKLYDLTGVPIPHNIMALSDKKILHPDVVEKNKAVDHIMNNLVI